jgi:transcriptional regulator with XRE-family HTH domain
VQFRADLARELRKRRGLTQAALAVLIGCSRSTVAMWESGTVLPGAGHLYRLAKQLNVQVDDLRSGSGADAGLRRLRLAAGRSRRSTAAALQVATTTYAGVETGLRTLPESWIHPLAATFRTEADKVRRAASETARNRKIGKVKY